MDWSTASAPNRGPVPVCSLPDCSIPSKGRSRTCKMQTAILWIAGTAPLPRPFNDVARTKSASLCWKLLSPPLLSDRIRSVWYDGAGRMATSVCEMMSMNSEHRARMRSNPISRPSCARVGLPFFFAPCAVFLSTPMYLGFKKLMMPDEVWLITGQKMPHQTILTWQQEQQPKRSAAAHEGDVVTQVLCVPSVGVCRIVILDLVQALMSTKKVSSGPIANDMIVGAVPPGVHDSQSKNPSSPLQKSLILS